MRRQSTLACGFCGKGNKNTNTVCWNCQAELQPTSKPFFGTQRRDHYSWTRNPSQDTARKTITELLTKYSFDEISSNPELRARLYDALIKFNEDEVLELIHGIISEEEYWRIRSSILSLMDMSAKDLMRENIMHSNYYRRHRFGRRNPQRPVWGSELWTDTSPVWREPLYRNPQAPVWHSPLWTDNSAVWRGPLYRNPQAPVWQSPLWTNDSPVWRGPLYRRSMRRHNPQAPVWHSPLWTDNSAVWRGPLYRRSMRRHNPQAPVWHSPLWTDNSAVWRGPLYRNRNPQAPVWHSPLWTDNSAVWRGPLYRNPEDALEVDEVDEEIDETSLPPATNEMPPVEDSVQRDIEPSKRWRRFRRNG